MTLIDQSACNGISQEMLCLYAGLNSVFNILCHNTSRAKTQPTLSSAHGSPSLGHRTKHTDRFRTENKGLHHVFLSSKAKARAGMGVSIDPI